jgi:DNA-binding beta-propeller fold protein YncE
MRSASEARLAWHTSWAAGVLGFAAVGCLADEGAVACPDARGVVCTWAGTGEFGFDGDGKAPAESNLYWPVDVTIDSRLGTYILDWNNHRVREVRDGALRTVIGTDFVGDGPDDLSDLEPPGAPGTEIHLNHPTQIVPTPEGTLVLVAWHNHKLRSYDPRTGLVVVVSGSAPGHAGDGGPARAAKLNQPSQMVAAEDGTRYVLDQRNQVVRRIGADGVISTLAGTPGESGFSGDGGPAREAKFSFPTGPNPQPGGGLALDERGRLYVSDTLNHRVRRIDLENGVVTTVGGTGEAGFGGDGGPAIEAKLNFPRKLTLGPDGRIYLGDQLNHRIRAIDPETGVIEAVAGDGEQDFDGDGNAPTETSLDRPTGVSFDRHGAMYVVDTFNSRIRRVLPEDEEESEHEDPTLDWLDGGARRRARRVPRGRAPRARVRWRGGHLHLHGQRGVRTRPRRRRAARGVALPAAGPELRTGRRAVRARLEQPPHSHHRRRRGEDHHRHGLPRRGTGWAGARGVAQPPHTRRLRPGREPHPFRLAQFEGDAVRRGRGDTRDAGRQWHARLPRRRRSGG